MKVPRLIVLAGPNGAGKTTSSRALLADTLRIATYVNADAIAQGLSGFAPESSALEAGRIMLRRLKELADERADFAFETTLAARSYVRWLTTLQQSGYRVELHYFWLASPELAIARVAHRVRNGGHSIPTETIRRRYIRSLQNLMQLYLPFVDEWTIYDNSGNDQPRLVATGVLHSTLTVYDHHVWNGIQHQMAGPSQ